MKKLKNSAFYLFERKYPKRKNFNEECKNRKNETNSHNKL